MDDMEMKRVLYGDYIPTKATTTLARKGQLIRTLEAICAEFDLSFDGPGSHNFRKLPNRDVWTIYIRSKKDFLWLLNARSLSSSQRAQNKLYQRLCESFSVVKLKGGCSGYGLSVQLGF